MAMKPVIETGWADAEVMGWPNTNPYLFGADCVGPIPPLSAFCGGGGGGCPSMPECFIPWSDDLVD